MTESGESWALVKRELLDVLEQGPERGRERLAVLARDSPEVAAEVEALLDPTGESAGFLEIPALERARAAAEATGAPLGSPVDEALPERIGPYRPLSQLGRGGMGSVYLCLRPGDELDQPVAVKVITRGMDSEAIVRRFRNERQILASLHHPGIARLYEGGTTETGSPYFVMEYIEGLPLDRFCEERGLSMDERLLLFREVCAAVQYAHQNLVVHRDLKPNNILVTPEGLPKLLDFGIAKLLDPQADSQGADLTALDRPLTPDYASPEQVRGEAMTTASDVYSLGVVLYRLLTGQLPYDLSTRSPQEILRLLHETSPARPSTAAGRAESLPPERRAELRRRLAGDLDNIVLKAMHRESERRYASAEQLAEDIRRHLEGFPVKARQDTVGYRARKFVARHRVAVLAGAAVAVALIATTGLALWQARAASVQRARAEARFNDVRKLAHTVIFDMHDAIAALPGSTPARQLLVTGALEYLDGLAREANADASLQRELANAYDRVADVQGLPAAASLGDLPGALATYRKAQAIRTRLASDGEPDRELRRELSATCLKLATVLYYSGDTAGGVEQARLSCEIEESLAEGERTPLDLVRLGRSYMRHGYLLGASGNTVESLRRLRQSIAVLEPLANGGEAAASEELATACSRLGEILEGGNAVPGVVPDLPEALRMHRRALALDRALLASEPTSVARRRSVVADHVNLGQVTDRTADRAGALEQYRLALPIIESLSAEDPANAQARSDEASVRQRIGTILARQGDAEGALPHLERALRLLEELSAKDPSNLFTRSQIAETHVAFGFARAAQGAERSRRTEERVALYRRAREHLEKGLAFWMEARERGVTTGAESEKPEELAREIAACDRALAALSPPIGR